MMQLLPDSTRMAMSTFTEKTCFSMNMKFFSDASSKVVKRTCLKDYTVPLTPEQSRLFISCSSASFEKSEILFSFHQSQLWGIFGYKIFAFVFTLNMLSSGKNIL